jgi:hypothetical protein
MEGVCPLGGTVPPPARKATLESFVQGAPSRYATCTTCTGSPRRIAVAPDVSGGTRERGALGACKGRAPASDIPATVEPQARTTRPITAVRSTFTSIRPPFRTGCSAKEARGPASPASARRDNRHEGKPSATRARLALQQPDRSFLGCFGCRPVRRTSAARTPRRRRRLFSAREPGRRRKGLRVSRQRHRTAGPPGQPRPRGLLFVEIPARRRVVHRRDRLRTQRGAVEPQITEHALPRIGDAVIVAADVHRERVGQQAWGDTER